MVADCTAYEHKVWVENMLKTSVYRARNIEKYGYNSPYKNTIKNLNYNPKT